MSALGGNKPSYIWTVNGSRWFIISSIAGTKILAQAYGSIAPTTWEIPQSRFDAEFVEAKDVPYMNTILNHQPTAGWSSRLLRDDYIGSALNARRDSDNTNQDIGFIDSYGFDKTSFNTFIGAGNGFTEIWYDQFGAHNATNVIHANQPLIAPNGSSNSRPAQIFDGINDILAVNSLAPFFSGNDKPITIISLVSRNTILQIDGIMAAGNSISGIPHYALGMDATPSIISERHSNLNVAQHYSAGTYTANTYTIVGMMFDNNTITIIVNGNIYTATLADIGTITVDTCAIGGAVTNVIVALFDGRIDELLFWHNSIGLDDLQTASFNMSQFYAIY